MKKRALLVITALLPFSSLAHGADAAGIWKSKCAICHGVDGAGRTAMAKKAPMKDYTTTEGQAAFTDEQASVAIRDGVQKDGKSVMPAYAAKLSADEIAALVAHVRSLKQ